MLVHHRVTPSIECTVTHLYMYPWVERGTVRFKYLAQEHNTMSPTRAWARKFYQETSTLLTMRPSYLTLTQSKLGYYHCKCVIHWKEQEGEILTYYSWINLPGRGLVVGISKTNLSTVIVSPGKNLVQNKTLSSLWNSNDKFLQVTHRIFSNI